MFGGFLNNIDNDDINPKHKEFWDDFMELCDSKRIGKEEIKEFIQWVVDSGIEKFFTRKIY
jgi:hypothetical protein